MGLTMTLAVRDIIDQTKLTDINGWTLRAYLTPDYDTSVTDYDCYDTDTIETYYRDLWSYVGIVVEASRAGITLGTASLWACEYGAMPGIVGWVSPLTDDQLLRDLAGEAIADAQTTLAQLLATAT